MPAESALTKFWLTAVFRPRDSAIGKAGVMWQVVLMINGYFISILGAAMLIAAGYDIYDTSASWSPFLSSALFAFLSGFRCFFPTGRRWRISASARDIC